MGVRQNSPRGTAKVEAKGGVLGRPVEFLFQVTMGDPAICASRSLELIEHDMEVLFKLADNITILHRGRVIADGPPAAVESSREVRSAYLGASY